MKTQDHTSLRTCDPLAAAAATVRQKSPFDLNASDARILELLSPAACREIAQAVIAQLQAQPEWTGWLADTDQAARLQQELSTVFERMLREKPEDTGSLFEPEIGWSASLVACREFLMHLLGELALKHAGDPSRFLAACQVLADRVMHEIHQAAMTQFRPDRMTGLSSRIRLQDRIRHVLAQAARNAVSAAVLLIDIDRFRYVNDTFGVEVGDKVLDMVVDRLSHCIRETDTLARYVGDEFVMALADGGQVEDVSRVARAAIRAFAEPFEIDGQQVVLTASLGVSLYPRDGEDVPTLLKHADIAMQRAKEAGNNRFEFFTAEANQLAQRRMTLAVELRQALAREEFALHYQPQVALSSGRVVGMEALLRWAHPQLGQISPAEFIPIAEQDGLIMAIGVWVLKTACAQAKAWLESGLPPLRMAVNLSARHFHGNEIVELVAETLQTSGLAPQHLELEVTEGVMMQHGEVSLANLNAIRALGVHVSVDDFGTGYSSLNYLKRMPVSTVKIDQSFVKYLTSDPGDAALIKAIIAMAHSLNLRVIAEGVETEGQLAQLARLHCDEIQGYYFSRPLPADECTRFLQELHLLALPKYEAEGEERVLLLVDDEANITNALRRLLRQDGYRILVASSGREGLELLATHPVGVIISDQRMPEMTGVEFLRRVKDLYPDTIRMVLSGYTELKSVTDAINEGAIYKFITKPWEDDLLREHVREAFQRHGMKQENERLAAEIALANRKLSEINQVLEQRVEDKTREIQHSLRVLKVSQDVLDHMPAAVVGIDTDGLIVMANQLADRLFAKGREPLLGWDACSRLPAALCACLERGEADRILALEDGQRMHVICCRMGGTRTTGSVLVMLPLSETAGAIPSTD